MTRSVTIEGLLSAFRDLPPWSSIDFSTEEWREYVHAARVLQNAEPASVERALVSFLDEAEDFAGVENETRLFLLLRVVFDLPDRASADQRRVFKGWVNWPAPDPDGPVSLSWPVGWQHGRPVLLAPFEGAEGPRYGAIEEYRYLLDRFPFRKIGTAEG